MIANAAQALDKLGDEHQITIAKNTKLARVTDQLAALLLHDNVIAYYGERAVQITTDWHTGVTWRRLNALTPMNSSRTLLRFVDQPNGDRVLYEPGIKVDENGMVLNPMMPTRQARIERALKDAYPRLRRYGRTAVEAWDLFREDDCECLDHDFDRSGDQDADLHLIEHLAQYHLDDMTPSLPWRWRRMAELRADNCHTTAVTEYIRKNFTTWLMTWGIPHYVWMADPKFQFHYPQPKETS